MPSALDLAVLTILRPHFRIQNGASSVSAEGLEALATMSPRDEAGQRRVQTMLRRKVMAQHVDRPCWLHVFPVVPCALATLCIASSQIDMAWIEREMRGSLVIDVEEWGVEPQGEMRDDEREVLFLSSDDDGESCPQSKRQVQINWNCRGDHLQQLLRINFYIASQRTCIRKSPPRRAALVDPERNLAFVASSTRPRHPGNKRAGCNRNRFEHQVASDDIF